MDGREAIGRLVAAAGGLSRGVAFMEVCGTHTVNAFRSGLHSLTPGNVRLLSGPGCPVCVTAQGEIDRMISLAGRGGVTVCTYGDLLRVPGSGGTLEEARSRGADVRIIYSTLDAVAAARKAPEREVVLAAVGFETTTPATAVAIRTAAGEGLDNFSVLASHKLVIPAMHALLRGGKVAIDGFLCPGHVAIMLGADAFGPIVAEYGLPCVIAGFEDVQIAAGLARLTELAATGVAALENQYPQAVTAKGNEVARRMVAEVFEPADVVWRGLGMLAGSGLAIREEYGAWDAAKRFELGESHNREPAGCRCGEVITGRCVPSDCGLFGESCTPTHPVGPCMVSAEGTCGAWFRYGSGRKAAGR